MRSFFSLISDGGMCDEGCLCRSGKLSSLALAVFIFCSRSPLGRDLKDMEKFKEWLGRRAKSYYTVGARNVGEDKLQRAR